MTMLLEAALALASLLAPAASAVEEIRVLRSGQQRPPVAGYKIGSTYYLAAKEAGDIFDAQVYWYPVSGRVQMSRRGEALQFLVDSDTARLGARELKLDAAVMLRTNQAFIPLSFFLSEEFSEWAGVESVFNPRTKLLTVDRRGSIGPVRWSADGGAARLSVELAPKLRYSASGRGHGGVELSFPFGAVEAPQEAELPEGPVAGFSLTQSAKAAKLSVRFAEPGAQWRVRELSEPRRVVLEVHRRGGPPPVSEAAPPAAPKPAAPAKTAPRAAPSAGPAVIAHRDGRARRRIVIDAGHGGKDPGTTSPRGVKEKDINLAAARELAELLKADGRFDVLLTRQDDSFVPLADRSRMANEFGADLFISLHCNASPHARESGFEVYFLSEKASDPEAARLAERENAVLELEGKSPEEEMATILLGELTKTENINAASEFAALLARALGGRVDLSNRGVKQAAFYVLRGTRAPAVLFEMAFLSNRKDESKLESKRFRRQLLEGVHAGIIDYGNRQGWFQEELTGRPAAAEASQ